MYKILIVDDEKIIRTGISDILAGEEDIEVYTASNGLEALDVLSGNDTDGIILDIKMPGMDGLSLLKNMNKNQRDDLVIFILSGHDEFEYAQKAIKYGIEDYLLKPITPKQVRNLSDSIKQKIRMKYEKRREIESLKEQVQMSKPIIKERFFWDLINQKLSSREYNDRLSFLGIDWKFEIFRLALIEIISINKKNEERGNDPDIMNDFLIYKSVENLLNEISEKDSSLSVFQLQNGMFAVIWNSPEGTNAHEILEKIQGICVRKLGLTATISVGGEVSGYRNIRNSYWQAKKTIDYQRLLGEGCIYDIEDFEVNYEVYDLNILIEDICIAIKTENKDEVKERVNLFFKTIRAWRNKVNIETVYLFCNKCISEFLSILMVEYEISISDVFQSRTNPFAELMLKRTITDIENFIVSLSLEITSILKENRVQKTNSIVEKIKQYINVHYNDEINNQVLSSVFKYSPNYLGLVFNTETTLTISDFLNNVRVNEAKKLLKTSSLLNYEIAYKVGYKDQHYFSAVFKKIVGLSPSEYKNV